MVTSTVLAAAIHSRQLTATLSTALWCGSMNVGHRGLVTSCAFDVTVQLQQVPDMRPAAAVYHAALIAMLQTSRLPVCPCCPAATSHS
jgi:hypothetical protein